MSGFHDGSRAEMGGLTVSGKCSVATELIEKVKGNHSLATDIRVLTDNIHRTLYGATPSTLAEDGLDPAEDAGLFGDLIGVIERTERSLSDALRTLEVIEKGLV